MNIQKTLSGAALTVALEGRLDTTTAPKLEEELRGSVDGVSRLVFDLESWSISPPRAFACCLRCRSS